MLFSKHSKDSAHLSKEHFADLALSLRPGEAHPPADTREWALAHVGSFKDQLIRLERSMAFISDSARPSSFEVSRVLSFYSGRCLVMQAASGRE